VVVHLFATLLNRQRASIARIGMSVIIEGVSWGWTTIVGSY